MTLWGGRFSTKLNEQAWDLNSSLPVDQRMAIQDVDGSRAWADAIHKAGILSDKEHASISLGLGAVKAEFASGQFSFVPSDEDIHTAVERRLSELIGAAAGKLHTGRSRNDQVATDFRLWMLNAIPEIQSALNNLQLALVELAEAALPRPKHLPLEKGLPSPNGKQVGDEGEPIIMPGYTHLQRAQPILLAHLWLSHFWALRRDVERLKDLTKRVSVLPLGSGALAGAPFPVGREQIAKSLEIGRASCRERV